MSGTTVRAATGPEIARWETDRISRQRQVRLAAGMSPDAVDQQLAWAQNLLKRASGDAMLAVETPAGVGFAHCLVFGSDSTCRGFLVDVWVPADLRGRGLGRAARDAARQWCVEQGAISIGADFFIGDPATDALLRDWPLDARRMALPLHQLGDQPGEQTGEQPGEQPGESGVRPELPPGISVRPLTAEEYAVWRSAQITGFAEQLVDSGADPDEAHKRSAKSFADLLPQGTGTPAHIIRLVCVDDEPIGSVWVNEHWRGDWSFIYALEVDEAHRGKGYGTAVVLACEQLAWESGDRAIALNVFSFNTVAVRLYEKLGFQVYEVSRRLALF